VERPVTAPDDLAAAFGQLAEQQEKLQGQGEAIADLYVKLTALRGELRHRTKQPGGKRPADEDNGDDTGYDPAPTVEWWRIGDEDRAEAVRRLEAWVGQVFVPGYGHLAKMLPACWKEHPLCLYGLDVLSELWSVLYLDEDRGKGVLAGQAELQTRILPALAAQFEREAVGCEHSRSSQNGHQTYPARSR
jgi:hypothetical protein